MKKYADKGTVRQHLTNKFIEASIRIAGQGLEADEVLRDIAENDLPVWMGEVDDADVREVRRGQWVKRLVPTDFDGEVFDVEHIVCSVCEAAIPLNKVYKTDWYSDFCPSCGSEMTESEE